MQSSSPMDPSTLRNPWQRASRSASQMRSTRRATINQYPLPGKDHHHQNSAETQKGEGCIPPTWQARPGGFGTTAFRPQQAQRIHAQETKNRSFPNVSLWWGGPDTRACSSEDQIVILRIILEQSLEWQSPVYIKFIDFKKAFDMINRSTMWRIMRQYGIPLKIVSIIRNFFTRHSRCFI